MLLLLLAAFDGHADNVYSLAFSPDGKTLASASADGTARLWDMEGKALRILGTESPCYQAVFFPDGKSLLTASGDGKLRLWDVRSGKRVRVLEGPHKEAIRAAAISKEGLIASGDKSGKVVVWKDGKPLRELEAHPKAVNGVAFRGKRLATAGEEGAIKLWEDGKEVAVLKGHRSAVYRIEWSADGRLASASQDKTARIWRDGKSEIVKGDDPFYGVAWAGKRLAICGEGRALLWADGKRLAGHKEAVYAVAASPDGKRLASAGAEPAIRMWDVGK